LRLDQNFFVHPSLDAVAASGNLNMIAGVDDKGLVCVSFVRQEEQLL
jgi:hypothetical protein